ncbi:MAG: site-2 protease family protein [Gemmatimonadales bacterium]|nr:site-2 protease family protein [Gemmatimonadales bacterium]
MEVIVIRIMVLVFSVIVHEYAHGWTAWKLGDSTARDSGRLTFNPLPHIDPVGSILVPLMLSFTGSIMLGWAKPVPVVPDRLFNPANDHPKVAAAGPLSNLLLALIFSFLLGLAFFFWGVPSAGTPAPGYSVLLFEMFQVGILINVVLAIFNLLPLPPLDGSWILVRFLPTEARLRYLQLHRFGLLTVVGFLLLVRYTFVGDWVSSGVMGAVYPFFKLSLWLANPSG